MKLINNIEITSVGGWDTCIYFPNWDLCFDIGSCPQHATKASNIFVTHSHIDHLGGIARHCGTRELKGMSPPIYWVPDYIHKDIEDLFDIWRRLNRSPLQCTIKSTHPNDIISFTSDRELQCVRVDHSIPTHGYALITKKQKLLPNLIDKSSEDLIVMKSKGFAITETLRHVDVFYTGDTTINVIDNPLAQQADTLIMECTFLDYIGKVNPDGVKRQGHVHIDHIVERQDEFKNKQIILTHFSSRYKREYIEKVFSDSRLSDSFKSRLILV